MRRSRTFLFTLLAFVALGAAACTSDGGDDGDIDQPDVPTVVSDDVDGPAASVAAGWSATAIGQGIKPVLALDGSGSPAVAYLIEDVGEGFVAFASAAEGWTPDRLIEGYFYGPIGLAFDPQGQPNVVYHDHQASQFQQDLGDLTYAVRDASGWQVAAAEDDGHDGWDSTIAIGADGVVRAAGIDPSQFDGTDGVEYYELRDGAWTVTAIGSGPIKYEFNVSLAVGPDGLPALSYYDDIAGDLIFASFDGGSWNLETVASEGDVGKFSSLQFDAQGRPHISFFEEQTSSSGRVRYAVRDGDTWTIEEIGTLANVALGPVGARRNSSLALDALGVPHVAFSDRSVIRYATRTDAGWQVDEIATADGGVPLGQLVSLELDGAGTPHLAFYEMMGSTPSSGRVVYLTRE